MKYKKLINKKIVLFISLVVVFFLNFFFLNHLFINFTDKNTQLDEFTNVKRVLFSGFENKKTENICEKANNDLLSLYDEEYYDFIAIDMVMKKSTSYFYKYLKEKDENYLKKYIFSFKYEIILSLFIVIIIIIWVGICCLLSKVKCCCFYSNKKPSRWFKNLLWALSICLFLINILLIFPILFHFYSSIQVINNSFCSLFKITYHTYFGEEKNYKIRPKWIGINGIKNLLLKTKDEIEDITNDNKEIYNILNHDIKKDIYYDLNENKFLNNYIDKFCNLSKYDIPNPDPLQERPISNFYYCPNILNLIQNEYNENFSKIITVIEDIYEKMKCIDINKNGIKFSLDNGRNKIDSFVKIINDLEIQYFDTLYYIIDEVINKYFIIMFYVFFMVVMLIEILGLTSLLSFLCCSDSKYCYKLYLSIINMHILATIIIILITIFFSLSSTIIRDISTILQYSIYSENENFEKNTEFSFSKFQYDIEGINICLKSDGNLDNYTQLNTGSESLVHFYSMINLIKENLYYLLNNKFLFDKNEIKKLFNQLKKEVYLIQYQLEGDNTETNYFKNDTYITPEWILEKVLNNYTNNNNSQNIGNNSYYANYFFVHSDSFCLPNYTHISKDRVSSNYQKGKNCMKLEDFPENSNFFREITLKNLETYNLENLTKEFKKRYFDKEKGFETIVIKVINSSKHYFNERVEEKLVRIKNKIVLLLQIIDNKIDILFKLYDDVLGKNNTNLLSAFNCKYLKRDINIFINQLEVNLSHTLFTLSIYSIIISIFSLLCIVTGTFTLKLNKMINNYELKTINKNDIDNDIDFSEKPKVNIMGDKNIYDENLKSSCNEKEGFYKITKTKKKNELSKQNTK